MIIPLPHSPGSFPCRCSRSALLANERNQFKWPVIGVQRRGKNGVPALNLFPVVADQLVAGVCGRVASAAATCFTRDHLDGQLNS